MPGLSFQNHLYKYVSFAVEPVSQLLEAYRLHPGIFGENLNIPESGKGIPDLLDEVQWEIDWLKKMQDATGTGGLLLTAGICSVQHSSCRPVKKGSWIEVLADHERLVKHISL